MIGFLRRFRHDRSGATAIEYGMIAALLGIGVAGTVLAIGSRLNAKFSPITNMMN